MNADGIGLRELGLENPATLCNTHTPLWHVFFAPAPWKSPWTISQRSLQRAICWAVAFSGMDVRSVASSNREHPHCSVCSLPDIPHTTKSVCYSIAAPCGETFSTRPGVKLTSLHSSFPALMLYSYKIAQYISAINIIIPGTGPAARKHIPVLRLPFFPLPLRIQNS